MGRWGKRPIQEIEVITRSWGAKERQGSILLEQYRKEVFALQDDSGSLAVRASVHAVRHEDVKTDGGLISETWSPLKEERVGPE